MISLADWDATKHLTLAAKFVMQEVGCKTSNAHKNAWMNTKNAKKDVINHLPLEL